ncbi:Sel1-like protein [Botryosphaeria dothidea]|uniref:Sel1-like protein n=1 Tax=Botryosphaeria dothidea TaxID=55169 RepID=A0A8H4IPV7_9PEZI|nr:Sel1-like protein [Botryosphaeria dothidea]
MSYQQHPHSNNFGLAATFVPGGTDDYYLPPQPELVSPAPQRIMQEDVDQIQNQVAHLELEANGSAYPPRGSSMHSNTPSSSNGSHYKQSDYSQYGKPPGDVPNFSPFPKLVNPPPNIPPTDDEKEQILEIARMGVLNSNDPEMQLAWAQDSLTWVDASMVHAERVYTTSARPPTPAVEHQLRMDAMNIVQFLADQHHPRAEFMRGMWLEFGKFGMRIDKKEAFRCYSRAADKGYWRAEYRIGMLFEQSNDPVKALVHYKRGADAGDSASNYRLGMMTLLGQNGQQQDYAKGLQLIKHAASTADENAPQGAYVLGMLQARELPQITVPEVYLPYDEKSAKINIEKAAFLGFAKAQLKMGSAYELCTLGCDFNPALSLHYNALAARQGEPEADMAISKWFLCGYEGVFQKNEELAFVYAERAAQSGLATAEFALGYFHEIGVHTPVNLEKAMEWYEKAAKSGNKDAISRLENIQVNRTLSKKDHEKVAINKIRSQYGSKKGQRPDRFRQSQAAPMPTISDSAPQSPVHSPTNGRPPIRSSSTAPYPLEDRPPTVQPYDRPVSAAPYPMDNGPPNFGGMPPAQRPTSAFNVVPPGPGAPGAPAGRFPPQGPNYGPPRPHTSVDSMSPTGPHPGRKPVGHRVSSNPPGPGGYRQPGGPSVDYPEQQPYMSPPPSGGRPPSTPGYAPGPNKLQKQPTAQDIGFQAPLEQKKPPQLPVGYERASTAYTVPAAGPPVIPAPKPSGGRPNSSGRPTPQKSDSAPPQQNQQPKPPKETAPKPAATAPPPGKGPKTFDEMGVPKVKNDQDCIVM